MAHITGGGITDNLPRILPRGCTAEIDLSAWRVPVIFEWLQRTGEVPEDDMFRTFNMGMGLIVACDADAADDILASLSAAGEPRAVRLGRIVAGGEGVTYVRD
jgi:phosphoribosylformylglycinamidine cyclo-ligase